MNPASIAEAAPEPIRFRAGKKRKAYRQRTDDQDQDSADTPKSPASATATAAPEDTAAQKATEGDDGDDASVTAALRLRNARRGRLGGVAFRNSNRPDEEINDERALVPRESDEASNDTVLNSVANRFTHQTGMLADLNDKHMMEYIESRLSNRASGNTSQRKSSSAPRSDTAPQTASAPPKESSGREVMQGHLMEIDLGDDVRDRNVARTERITQGGHEDVPQGRRAKKPRLGRDGKPWRPRNRRGSDAVKRDQLVEEVLRETRLDVYEMPDQANKASAAEEDGAADDRLAEEFRQQFLEDVAQRQLRKKKPTNQPARPGSEDVLKGPKLGGSRNVRAQMRDLLLKKEKEGKK
ncbi:hypothetical protein CEP52_001655 [Fusarium oligoseptatum]|uniref:Uncharacterized protein n=1 Tax=Fusarium oligoseptatum TaxID=2604345 RepID=A0A428UII1_9HYPO|nr:hypothetical protein CEP52_001655 [Fusarium oligoseptatum]